MSNQRYIHRIAACRRSLIAGTVAATVGCNRADTASLVTLLQQPLAASQHETAARQYRDRAEESRSLAALHIAMAAAYRRPTTRTATDEEMIAHCEALIQLYKDAARRYEALAANHSALAQDARTRPGREFRDDRDY